MRCFTAAEHGFSRSWRRLDRAVGRSSLPRRREKAWSSTDSPVSLQVTAEVRITSLSRTLSLGQLCCLSRFPPPLTICPTGKRKSATLPSFSTQVLKEWLATHRACPYPSKVEKVALAERCQLTIGQVKTWFANARRRMKKPSKPRGMDVYQYKREGSHYPYRPIAPHPAAVDVAFSWSPPDSFRSGADIPACTATTNQTVSLTPPSHQYPVLPPISSFFQNKTGHGISASPSRLQLNGPFHSSCSTQTPWPAETPWLACSVPHTYTPASQLPAPVETLSRPTNLEEGNLVQRSAFTPVKTKSFSPPNILRPQPNILRPQPIKLLPTSSRIIQQNFYVTPMQHCNDHVNRQRSAVDVSTQQLDVALTLANMGE